MLGSYWVATAWPSGATMTLIAAATVGLSAATPNPKRMAFQMACGTFLGALIGFVEMFFIFPWIDGFPLLCVMLAPVIVLGSFLTSRPQYAGVGLGLLIFFSTGSVPDNLTVYNPYTFINDYIAMVMGMLVCAAAGAIILPPNSRWLWQRLEQDLRGQVVYAISGKLKGLASSFESRTRDLLHQAYGLAAGQPKVQKNLLRWMFVVLEVGHAIIELRKEQAILPVHPAYAESQPWRQAIRVMGRALVRLFLQPNAEQSGARTGRGRSCDQPCRGHRRAVRAALRYLGVASGEELPALHPHLAARPAITARCLRHRQARRTCPCLVKSPSTACTCRP